jgi:phosphoenolpyruvate carboxykinase (GTP)
MPRVEDFDLAGLDGFGAAQFEQAQAVSSKEWKQEVISQEELFINLHSTLPKELIFQKELLVSRI